MIRALRMPTHRLDVDTFEQPLEVDCQRRHSA